MTAKRTGNAPPDATRGKHARDEPTFGIAARRQIGRVAARDGGGRSRKRGRFVAAQNADFGALLAARRCLPSRRHRLGRDHRGELSLRFRDRARCWGLGRTLRLLRALQDLLQAVLLRLHRSLPFALGRLVGLLELVQGALLVLQGTL